MGDQTTAELTSVLCETTRVIILGGAAVIAHGLGRNTFDSDIWVEPFESPDQWSEKIRQTLAAFPHAGMMRIATWEKFSGNQLATIIEEDGVIRIGGLERPLDIFRRPNEFSESFFDEVWSRARPLDDGTRLPDAIDLLVTKQLTGREKDRLDILFLEQKAERESLEILRSGEVPAAFALMERFLTPNVAAAAARHADGGVRKMGLRYLRELAEEGDPFAADLLAEFAG